MPLDNAEYEKLEKPWKDYPSDEADLLEQMERYAREAFDQGAKIAAIALVVAVGNYEHLSPFPRAAVLKKANELLDELQGKELSWRWG